MGFCVDCIYELCDVIVCKGETTIKLPIVITSSDYYHLDLKYQNAILRTTVFFNQGDTVEFNLNRINENYCYEGVLTDNSGNIVPLSTDGNMYGAFRFCTSALRQLI